MAAPRLQQCALLPAAGAPARRSCKGHVHRHACSFCECVRTCCSHGWPVAAAAPQVGPLGAILTQLSAGGGARKVNVAVVMEEIDRMTARYEFRVRASGCWGWSRVGCTAERRRHSQVLAGRSPGQR